MFSKHYEADTGEGLIGGVVRSKLSAELEGGDGREVAAQIAEIYIEGVEEAYPEWKNQWDEGNLEMI